MVDHQNTPIENATFVAECVHNLLNRLHLEHGIPVEHVMSGAHAQVVTMLGSLIGGEAAYGHCLQMGENIRPMLSVSDVALAASTPHGNA